MPSQKNQKQQAKAGFTIIEVVLVLAIAGLIFLMVFVALPALQRSQRDTARRNDMSRVDTSLVQYMTNNQSSTSSQLPGAGKWEGTKNFSTCDTTTGSGQNSTTTTNTACKFVREYMNSGSGTATTNEFLDPSGEPYSLVITSNLRDSGSDAIAPLSTGAQNAKSKLTGSNSSGWTITDAAGAFDEHVVYVIPGSYCDGPVAKTATASNHFSVLYRLEGAGVYCIDDQ